MYEKVLVPLDGSELAECVFPHVKAFIEGCQVGYVVFVRVVEPDTTSGHGDYVISPEILEEMKSARKSAAKDYLDQVIKRFQHEGTALHSEVLFGRAAESLADYTKENDIDLIVIATHGRSGVTRWVRGSVADKVLRFSSIPVLMVRAPGTKAGI
jgi:nucleotide-binding universal stress UspA family protein